MEFYPARHEQSGLSAACLEDGSVVVRRGAEVLSTLRLFGDGFRARYSEWLVEPRLEFSPDGAWLAVSYGMGYVYLAESQTGRVTAEFSSLIWVPDPRGVRHRALVRFVDGDTLVYLSREKTANRLRRGTDGIWRPAGKLSPEEGREIMGEEFSLCCP